MTKVRLGPPCTNLSRVESVQLFLQPSRRSSAVVFEHMPPCGLLFRLRQHFVPVFHLIRSALRAQNDPPDLFVAAKPIEVHHVHLEHRVAHLIDGNIKQERLSEFRIQSPLEDRGFLLLDSLSVLYQPDLHVRVCTPHHNQNLALLRIIKPFQLVQFASWGRYRVGQVAMAHPKSWLGGPQCIWPHQ